MSHQGLPSSVFGCRVVRLQTSVHQVQGIDDGPFNNQGVLTAIDTAYQLTEAPFILLMSEDMIFKQRGHFLHEVISHLNTNNVHTSHLIWNASHSL
jgi:hypothetical protein